MKRSVRLLVVLCALVLLLTIAPTLITLTANVPHSRAAQYVAADDTPTGTPADTPTPLEASSISSSSSSSSSDVAPATPSMTGIIIATTLTCVLGLAGLVITIMAFSNLRRGGYGPFLRALLLGTKRASKGQSGGSAEDGVWDASHTLNYRPGPNERENMYRSYDAYDEYNDRDERTSRSRRSRGGAKRRSDAR